MNKRAAVNLLNKWLSEHPFVEKDIQWEKLKQRLNENRLSNRERFPEKMNEEKNMDSVTNREKEITQLTRLWYDIVRLDHYKDRDCHWTISKEWSYGNVPIYRVEHYGYVSKEICSEEFSLYEEAEKFLLKSIREAIDQEIEWAMSIITTSLSDKLEKEVIENANSILRIAKKYENELKRRQ